MLCLTELETGGQYHIGSLLRSLSKVLNGTSLSWLEAGQVTSLFPHWANFATELKLRVNYFISYTDWTSKFGSANL